MTRLAGGKPIPLPKGEAGRIAAALVKKFKPCGDGNVVPDFACTISRPVYRGKPVRVCAKLVDLPTAYDPHNPSRYNAPGGTFEPAAVDDPKAGYVAVHVTETCRQRAFWAPDMRTIIQHELAHAADPAVHARHARATRAIAAKAPLPRQIRREQSKRPDADYCGYINLPREIVARTAQVAHELSTTKVRQAVRRDVDEAPSYDPVRPEALLRHSPTYHSVQRCLTPKNKRKFLQLAARLWQSGRFGALPATDGRGWEAPLPKLPRDRPRR